MFLICIYLIVNLFIISTNARDIYVMKFLTKPNRREALFDCWTKISSSLYHH